MRIGELSTRTGVPVPTIKYYVREGLLASGERISHNQVSYGEAHERRLRLVRTLVEIGQLPIAKVREVLVEVDKPGRDLDSRLGVLAQAMAQTRLDTPEAEPDDVDAAMAIAERHGWKRVERTNFHVLALADVLRTLRQLGMDGLLDRVDDYARAAQLVAVSDIDLLRAQSDQDELLETMIVGTVVGDALFGALRRMAHIEFSGQQFQTDAEGPVAERSTPEDS